MEKQPELNATEPVVELPWTWRQRLTLAGLAVLGLTSWAEASQAVPNYPAVCPPLTAFATPTLFDVWWGTAPIRFPYG